MTKNILGFGMPKGFPSATYAGIHAAVSGKYKTSQESQWREWAGAWNGIAYRYSFCCDYSQSYTDSVKRHGSSPQPPERYIQEKNIFGFFVNGFSTIECFCYGLYAMTGFVDPVNFPLTAARDKKKVDFNSVLAKFESLYPTEKITISLGQVVRGAEFKSWSDIRNVLAHRSTPPRLFRCGGDRDGQTDWGDIDLNDGTTVSRLQWLTEVLKTLLTVAEEFVDNKL